jgi:serine/threonine-protein kinase
MKGSYAESLECFRRGHELGSKRPDWPYPSADWVREAERMKGLADRLPAVLRGEDGGVAPADAPILAQMCYDRGHHAAAVRLRSEAFAADPKLADDREHQNRYNAACSAALASSGRTKDDPLPDEVARAKLRAQALAWLRAELSAWSKASESHTPQARQVVRQNLQHWKEDADLAGIRDEVDLARLLEAERTACRRLWNDVDGLLKKPESRE